MALFSGARLGKSPWVAVTPLVALAASDAALGFFPYAGMGWVYAATLAIALGGWLLRARIAGPVSTLGTTLVAGALFFVVTNFGVWSAGQLYPLTTGGLGACFVAAIPFYGHQVAGDLVFATALFGLQALAMRVVARARATA